MRLLSKVLYEFSKHWMSIQILFGCEKQNNWILHRNQKNCSSIVMTAFVIFHTFSRFLFLSPFLPVLLENALMRKQNNTKQKAKDQPKTTAQNNFFFIRKNSVKPWSPTHKVGSLSCSVALMPSLTAFKMFQRIRNISMDWLTSCRTYRRPSAHTHVTCLHRTFLFKTVKPPGWYQHLPLIFLP